jgi:hypothetical protein
MTLIKLPAHKAGLFISHNEHRNYYESIADYLGRDYVGDFESPESRARCIATDEQQGEGRSGRIRREPER